MSILLIEHESKSTNPQGPNPTSFQHEKGSRDGLLEENKWCSNLYDLAMNYHNQGEQGNPCRHPCGEWLRLLVWS